LFSTQRRPFTAQTRGGWIPDQVRYDGGGGLALQIRFRNVSPNHPLEGRSERQAFAKKRRRSGWGLRCHKEARKLSHLQFTPTRISCASPTSPQGGGCELKSLHAPSCRTPIRHPAGERPRAGKPFRSVRREEPLTAQTRGGWIPDQVRYDDGGGLALQIRCRTGHPTSPLKGGRRDKLLQKTQTIRVGVAVPREGPAGLGPSIYPHPDQLRFSDLPSRGRLGTEIASRSVMPDPDPASSMRASASRETVLFNNERVSHRADARWLDTGSGPV